MRSDEVLKKTEEGMREGNKILIQELICDLEKKGISPVISVDGDVKKLTLKTRGDHHLEMRYEDLLKEYGFTKSDFCLLEENTTKPESNVIYPITSNVIIVNKKTAKLRQYKTGDDSNWITDLQDDLKNKFFDE